MVTSVDGMREYTCPRCGGTVLTISALRRVSPASATALWSEPGTAGSPPGTEGGDPGAPVERAGAGVSSAEAEGELRCPFCRRQMRAAETAAGRAALCRPCEAVWLDRTATESVKVEVPPAQDAPTLASERLQCPQCGAPVAHSWDENCQYCGASLHAPVKVVVVPEAPAGSAPWDGAARGLGEELVTGVSGVLGVLRRYRG